MLVLAGCSLIGRYINALGDIYTVVKQDHHSVPSPPPSEPATPSLASWAPSSPYLIVPAGRPAPLCRLTGYQPEHHLVRATHDGASLVVDRLTDPGSPPGELLLRLPAVAERHAGRYTCTLVDHRTGGMVRQEVDLQVDSGEWTRGTGYGVQGV